MWKLTIRSPLNTPREYVLANGTHILGRYSDSEIVVNDESASRRHAEFHCQNDSLTVHDLNSTNGTYVNRIRIQEAQELKDGDQIRVGFHIASVKYQKTEGAKPETDRSSITDTQPFTRDLLLEAIDKNAVLVHEFSNRLTSILDLDLVLQEISKFFQVAIGADQCQVILADQFDQINELGFSKAIADQAIQKRSVIVVPDTYHIKSISDSAHHYRIRTALCIPVMHKQEIIALVYAYKTDAEARPFDQNDVHISIAISHQAALAIQRSQLIEKVHGLEQLALKDSLTGLDNRRRFLTEAKAEVKRARRFNHPLTLLMLDIDNFKNVNDTYGHIAGDQVLIAVSNRLQNNLRSVDLLARIGGDEFVIMLVEADEKYAESIAKRLLRTIVSSPVKSDRGDIDITISVGIATLNEGHATELALLQTADDALYAAKGAGKNQIEIAANG